MSANLWVIYVVFKPIVVFAGCEGVVGCAIRACFAICTIKPRLTSITQHPVQVAVVDKPTGADAAKCTTIPNIARITRLAHPPTLASITFAPSEGASAFVAQATRPTYFTLTPTELITDGAAIRTGWTCCTDLCIEVKISIARTGDVF